MLEVRHEENHIPMKLRKDNTSGVPGVSWDKTGGKWRARIKVRNRTRQVGMFDDLEEAKQACIAFKQKYK